MKVWGSLTRSLMANIRLSVPSPAKRGDIVEVKALIMHPMETGFRADSMGKVFPKRIITLFECFYNDVEVIKVELDSGVAPNPFFAFFIEARETGSLTFRWHDQNGEVYEEQAPIEVS